MRFALFLLLLFPALFLSSFAIGQNVERLKFIENKGQWNDDVDFQALVPGGRVGVYAGGFYVQLLNADQMEAQHVESHHAFSEASGTEVADQIDGHYFQINLVGANQQAQASLGTPLTSYYNYFIGKDSSLWAQNAKTYESILYLEVYDGIDFRVSSVGNNLKYDFIVKPGADPSQIKIDYHGVFGIQKTNDDLEIHTMVGTLKELKPYSYQVNDYQKDSVASEYRLDNNFVTFSFPEGYDETRELVIDPILIFSTYSGSTADNWGSTATPGEHGTLYSAGVTNQNSGGFFPATVGAYQTTNAGNFDMAIIKYDSAGENFVYATYLGGMNNDSPVSLVVDKATGDLIVLGLSGSPDFPTTDNAYDTTFNGGSIIFNRVLNTDDAWDIVVTRLNSTGDQLVGSTFVGGSNNDGLNTPKQSGGPLVANYGDEMRGDVITDDAGNVYFASVTSSSDFPIINGYDNTQNGATDGVVVKMAPDLSTIEWSSYIGGSGFDAAYSIKFDIDDNIILAGGTTSANFPVTTGAYQSLFNGIVDGWIARFAADGSNITHATYTGTLSFDQVYFIDLNASGNIFCYGQTAGKMPVTPGVYHNANSGQFLQKFSSDLSTLQFSTVFGSGPTNGLVLPNISPTAFLVNDCNNIYLAGWGGFVNSSVQTGFWQSSTEGMPVTEDAYQKTSTGSDFYFMVLNGDATKLVYSTYLGGTSSKTHVDGGTSRFDKYGVVYHAVCSGCSFGNTSGGSSSDFPTTPNAHSRINRSLNCNNAAFKFDLSSLRADFETNNTALTMPGFNNVCYPDTIVFQNTSIGGKDITWDFGDGTIVYQTHTDPKWVLHPYQKEGQYVVKLKILDLATCSQTDSISKIINYFEQDIHVGDDDLICEGTSFQLTASGGKEYIWTSEDVLFTSTEQSPFVQPVDSITRYFVTVTDANGCTKKDTINLGVIYDPHADYLTYKPDLSISDYQQVCFPDSILFKNKSVNSESFYWNFGDGKTLSISDGDTASFFHRYDQEGEYQVMLIASNTTSCNTQDTLIKTIQYFKSDFAVGDDGEICEGATFQLLASGGDEYYWFTEDNSFTTTESSPVVQPTQTTQYMLSITDQNNCNRKDTVEVRVVNAVDLEWDYQIIPYCDGRPSISVQNTSSEINDVTYSFQFGDGTSSNEREVTHMYESDNTYSLKLTAQREFCVFEETIQLPIYNMLIPNVITPEGTKGYNDTFKVIFGPELIPPQSLDLNVHLVVFNRWGEKIYESDDYRNEWNAPDQIPGIYYVQVTLGGQTTCIGWLHILK